MPSDVSGIPTLRQQLDGLPAHIINTWCSRYANDGMELEARAIIGRETGAIIGNRQAD